MRRMTIGELFAEWLWYKREKSRIANAFLKEVGKARGSDRHDEIAARYQERDDWLNLLDSFHLALRARYYDIDLPDAADLTMWERSEGKGILTTKGRTYLRKLIDEEKTRRFEVKVRWLKLLTPIITALAALMGATTGLVLALRK